MNMLTDAEKRFTAALSIMKEQVRTCAFHQPGMIPCDVTSRVFFGTFWGSCGACVMGQGQLSYCSFEVHTSSSTSWIARAPLMHYPVVCMQEALPADHAAKRQHCDVGGIRLGLGECVHEKGGRQRAPPPPPPHTHTHRTHTHIYPPTPPPPRPLQAPKRRGRFALWVFVSGAIPTRPCGFLIRDRCLVCAGLVKDRLGNPTEAIPMMESAVTHYKSVHGADGSSLIAKALTSVGKCKEKIGNLEEAGKHFEEAVIVFEKTTGRGPLSAGALTLLGKNQLLRKRHKQAATTLTNGCEQEIEKDALDLNVVWEILDALKRAMLGIVSDAGSLTQEAKDVARAGLRLAEQAVSKTSDAWKSSEGRLDPNTDGTTALFYMLGGEFGFACGEFSKTKEHGTAALQIFLRVDGGQCGGLIATCEHLLTAVSNA